MFPSGSSTKTCLSTPKPISALTNSSASVTFEVDPGPMPKAFAICPSVAIFVCPNPFTIVTSWASSLSCAAAIFGTMRPTLANVPTRHVVKSPLWTVPPVAGGLELFASSMELSTFCPSCNEPWTSSSQSRTDTRMELMSLASCQFNVLLSLSLPARAKLLPLINPSCGQGGRDKTAYQILLPLLLKTTS